MNFELFAYSVSLGAFRAAVNFRDFARVNIGDSVSIVIQDADGRINLGGLEQTNVIVGDDDQGPITAISFRTLELPSPSGPTSTRFAVIERNAVADVLLLPIDSDGRVIPVTLERSPNYVAGDRFPPPDVVLLSGNDNTPPGAADDAGTTAEDTPLVLSVLANDSDAEGDALSVTGTTDPANGAVAINPDGTLTYTPRAEFNGTDSFSYTIADGNGGSASATVEVTVTAVDDAPVATDDGGYATFFNTALAIDPADLLLNDGDGDPEQDQALRAMLHKAVPGMTAPFPAILQRTATISALPRAEKRFMMAMRIWISAVWRSGSRDMILSPKSFRQFITASTRLRT